MNGLRIWGFEGWESYSIIIATDFGVNSLHLRPAQNAWILAR